MVSVAAAKPETTVRACVSTFVSKTPLDVFNRMIPDIQMFLL